VLYVYGPFKEDGRHTAASNAAFDASLRAHNPDWGVRDLGEVADLPRRNGLEFVARVAMPANNLSVVFRRSALRLTNRPQAPRPVGVGRSGSGS
jgi:hypothetical protein